MTTSLLCLITILCCVVPKEVACECTKINACSCQDPKGVIDLSPLDGKTEPKYKDLKPTMGGDDYLFSWNPCSEFSEDPSCVSVSGCQVSKDKSQSYPIGTQESAIFATDSGTGDLSLQYTATDGTGGVRSMTVALTCEPTSDPGTLTVLGEVSTAVYSMSLVSIHCCPKEGPPGGGTSGATLSLGTILCIAFLGVVVVYVAAGIILQKYVRKASGLEVIPNYSLWSALPGLIKAGFVFTFGCCKRRQYDKI